MRLNRPMKSGLAATLVVAALLSGCGNPGLMAPGAKAGHVSASASTVVDEPDLPLNQMPAEVLKVPSYALRAPQPMTYSNSAKLHISPVESLPALKAMINKAERSIYLETFNFGNDSYGQQIVPLLVAKAKAGLEVKVVMDYVGSRFLKGHKGLVKAMRDGGVDVRVYRPRTIKKDNNVLGINITHRKVYLADGEVALVGGVNLVAPFDTEVQDLLVEWRGPVVAQLYNEFAYDWHAAKGGALMQNASGAPAGDIAAQITLTSPGEARFEAKRAFYDAVEHAEREILIEQQYLWDDQLMDKLESAAKRGVKIRVIVPGASDTWKNIHAGELAKIAKWGGEARLYRGLNEESHLHAKVIIVDDAWAVVGSINGDTRALVENQELGVTFTDRELVGELKQRLFEADWAHHSKPAVYNDKWFIKPVRTLMELIDYYL